jgi:hypothetical protein
MKSAAEKPRLARVFFRRSIRGLVGRPLPIINEAHGEWRTGKGVSERLSEGQRRAAPERLRHSRAIRRALRVRGVPPIEM